MARKRTEPEVEALVSGGRFLADFFAKMTDEVVKSGGKLADIHRLVTDDGKETRAKIVNLIVSGAKAVTAFNVWRAIKLGTGLVTADDFRRALKKAGYRISDWANDILGQRAFTASTKETEVDLVVVSVAELGFPKGATRQKIYRKVQELGLTLCPAEVGPQLRLQYPDQPLNERLLIGMEPIAGSVGGFEVFRVERYDGGSWLGSDYGSAGVFWGGGYRWVFLRRK